MTLTQTIAQKIVTKLGFGEIEAIVTLFGLISKCFFNGPLGKEMTPAEHLSEHYDPTNDTFDSETLNQVYPQTCKAIRINHRKKGGKRLRDYSRIELTDLSNEALRQAMNQPTNVAMAVLSEAPNDEEDDDAEIE